MSKRPAWQCSRCRYQLGEVINGALRVWVPFPLIGPESTAATCPRCGAINVWCHQVQTRAYSFVYTEGSGSCPPMS